MPSKPLKPCAYPGCHRLVTSGRCAVHRRLSQPTPAKREMDKRYNRAAWLRARDAWLEDHPYCVECGSPEKLHVDHSIPHRGDWQLFWDTSNWQTLCHSCHSKKTYREERVSNNVVLVCGPPGGGKSYYVKQHRNPGDILIDIDELFVSFIGGMSHDNPNDVLPFVLAAFYSAVETIRKASTQRRVWVVRCFPRRQDRADFAAKYNANVILCIADESTCRDRIRNRGGKIPWGDLVRAWFAEYEPYDNDVVIGDVTDNDVS